MKTKRGLIALVALTMVILTGIVIVGCGGSDAADGNGMTGGMDDHDDGMDGGEDMHDESTPGEQDVDGDAAYLRDEPIDVSFTVDMTSFAFDPEDIEAGVGDVIEITIVNTEPVEHDFTIDSIDADVLTSLDDGDMHMHDDAGDADVHFGLTEEGTGTVLLSVHEPGEYTFYCTVAGHRESGMEGKLTIR